LNEEEVLRKPWGGAVVNLLEITAALAGFHFRRGEAAEARTLIQRAIRLGTEAVAQKPGDPLMRLDFGRGHLRLADALAQPGECAEAERLYREAARIVEQVVAERPGESRARIRLVEAYAVHARFAARAGGGPEAESLYRQTATAYCEAATRLAPDDAEGHRDLARRVAMGTDPELRDPGQAVGLYELVLEACQAKLGPDHPDTLASLRNLAETCRTTGRLDQAERLLRDLLVRERRRAGPNSADTADVLARLGWTLLGQERHAEAEPVLRECLAIRAEKLPDDWRRFNALSLLGGALLGQKKYAEAEPLLLQGHEGMKQREATIPPLAKVRLPEAAERLVRLYEATGRADKARTWREKLPAASPAERAP
jgi:tetratricopeptide (TPR) repeat protein